MTLTDIEFGRALVAAGGLSPQARARLAMADTFRRGSPRVRDVGQEADEDLVSVQQPLPPRLDPRALPRHEGPLDGP